MMGDYRSINYLGQIPYSTTSQRNEQIKLNTLLNTIQNEKPTTQEENTANGTKEKDTTQQDIQHILNEYRIAALNSQLNRTQLGKKLQKTPQQKETNKRQPRKRTKAK